MSCSGELSKVEFVVLDVETTGLNPEGGDRICEIAGIKIKEDRRIDRFCSLINPQRKIPKEASEVNGITDEMLRDAPTIDEVFPSFLQFIQGSCLVAYNVDFDLGFIRNELGLLGMRLSKELLVVDVLVMARYLLPAIGGYTLGKVAKNLGIPFLQQHRALADAELTVEVFSHLLNRLKAKGIRSLSEVQALFGFNAKIANQRLASILQAIDLGAKLNIRYFSSSKGELTQRQISPIEVREEAGKSYLVAYCHLRRQERTFKVDGILQLEALGK